MRYSGLLPEHSVLDGKGPAYIPSPSRVGAEPGLCDDTARNQIARWLRSLHVGEATLAAYTKALGGFMEYFHWDIDSITPEKCMEFADSLLRSGLKASTADKAFRAIRQFYRWREKQGGVDSPFRKIRGEIFRFNFDHTKETAVTEAEVSRFVEINGDCLESYLVVLSFRTGLRLSDCCLLRWDNVDLEEGLLKVVCHKTRKRERTAIVPLVFDPTRPEHDAAKLILRQHERYQRREPSGLYDWEFMGQKWVNPRAAGFYLYKQSSLVRKIRMAFKKAGINKKSHRSSRHGFASVLVNSGINTYTAKTILGITSDKTLSHYVKPDANFYREAVAQAFQAQRRRDGIGAAIETRHSPILAA